MIDILMVLLDRLGSHRRCKKVLSLPAIPSVGWTVDRGGDVIGAVNAVTLSADSEDIPTVRIVVTDMDYWRDQHGFEDESGEG